MLEKNQRLIMALDVSDIDMAKSLVSSLGDSVHFYKIGLELLFSGQAFSLIEWLKAQDKKVFLDVKLHDIPATVSRSIKQIDQLGVDLVTVHSYPDMIKAAVDAAQNVGILVVTILTSIDQSAFKELGYQGSIDNLVLKRAKFAYENGAKGVISSGHEAQIIRQNTDSNFFIISPGIRPDIDDKTSFHNEQKRVMTVQQAIHSGASHLVLGRPIRDASDPRYIASIVQQQIQSTLTK